MKNFLYELREILTYYFSLQNVNLIHLSIKGYNANSYCFVIKEASENNNNNKF